MTKPILEAAGRHSPICAALAAHVRERPNALAVRSESERESVTFRDLADRIESRSLELRAAVPPGGSPVALATGNSLLFIESFFALRAIGVPVLCLDAGAPREALFRVAAAMGARNLIVSDGAIALLKPETSPPAGTDIIKMTSGSTLDPRGACFTEAALVQGVDNIRRGMSLTKDDRVLISIPLSHSYGFDSGILSLALIGTPLILQQDVLPAALLASLRDHDVTFFPGVPALIRSLSHSSWKGTTPRLRSVVSASAPLSQEAADEFERASGFRVQQFLGSTETGGISFETDPASAAAEGAVGFPLPGVKIGISDEGLVRIHSAANRFALLPDAGPVPPHVETGDRGELTPEGRLRLLGRTAQVANVGGFKVDLAAIDAFLRQAPGVADAASVALDDPARGQRIVTVVESATRTPDALLELCRSRLSAREVPSDIRVVARLPRTERGKLDRAALLQEVR